MTLKQKLMSLTKNQLIIILQIVFAKMGKKKTFAGLSGPRFIIIHHTVENNGFESVNWWHKQKWSYKSSLGFYCGYSLYLQKPGKWFRARADNEEGAHCPGHNRDSIGIGVQGDYRTERLSNKMDGMLGAKVDELRIKYNIPRQNVLGDKEGRIPTRPTACPCGLMEFVKNYRGS